MPVVAAAAGRSVSVAPLSNVALFQRCYAHLTRSRVPSSSPLLGQVTAGTLTPVDACIQVLGEAALAPSGQNQGYLSGVAQASPEALATLRTFHDLHLSWFPSNNFTAAFPVGECFSSSVYDADEPALHLTRALFQPQVKYSAIVTTDPVMEGLRSDNVKTGNQTIGGGTLFNNGADQNGKAIQSTLYAVQTGALLGIRPVTLNSAKINQTLTATSTAGTSAGDSAGGVVASPSPHQSYGGGILGTPSFLLLNMGSPSWQTSNGGLVVSRRWSKNVFSNLLCRSLPVIRSTDAELSVQTVTTPATPPFRTGASCMQCHGGMDPMAGTIRNLSMSVSVPFGCSAANVIGIQQAGNSTLPSETGPVDDDPLYYQRPPRGRLVFRSYDGTLVNIPATGLAELGSALASTNDLYVCAAKRYFKFFTGIDVNLQDIGDPSNPPLGEDDLNYRNFVISLGLQLKQTQNLQSLVRSIISSDLYASPALKSVRAAGTGQ